MSYGTETLDFTRISTVPREIRIVQAIIAERFDLTVSELLSKTRRQRVCWPRQVAMAICESQTGFCQQDIAEAFGFEDHGTVYHAHAAVRAKTSGNEDARAAYGLLLFKASQAIKDCRMAVPRA